MEKPSEAELQFYYYMRGTCGNGVQKLITAIFALDLENRDKIALGFPELVDICNKYNNESGFYDKLLTKINNYYATSNQS